MTTNKEAWLGGIISAISSGALSSLTAMGFAPESFNFINRDAVLRTAAVAAVGGFMSVLNYLKQSPLPVCDPACETSVISATGK